VTRYRTIVADPPWAYDEGWPVGPQGQAAAIRAGREPWKRTAIDYPTLSVEAIAALPVSELAEDDAHLYLWTTNRYLWDARAVAEAWGFRCSQLLVWAKTPMGKGPGGAFAQNAEYVLFCRRGSLAHVEKQDSVWFNWKRQGKAHSRKPDAFLDMVEQVSPGPYVELFARRARFGWDYWGNESLGTAEIRRTGS
jgi:N6-adenosine-specific RNA methylase IME4